MRASIVTSVLSAKARRDLMLDGLLGYLSIPEAGRLIENKELSPVGLVAAIYQQINATDERVHSYVRLMRTSALTEARAAERRALDGSRIGPLDGIPIAVKDLFDTAGVVTTGGSAVYRERVPREDATCVDRLRRAGAVMIGKTNTHEFAMGGTTNNPHFGPTHNPWALDRVPGGSSGGSASALAAAQAIGALGTDTLGSIRQPAAFCGVTGIKPTYGLVGRGGVMPLTLTLDHAGPMARSAEDCALLLDALAGYDPRDLDSAEHAAERYTERLNEPIRGLRLAVIPSLVEGCEPDVLRSFNASVKLLSELGATVGECEPLAGLDEWRGTLTLRPEAALVHRDIYASSPTLISEVIRARLDLGLEMKAVDYLQALNLRKRIERQFAEACREWDAFLTPTCPRVAEPIGSPEPTDKFRATMVFNHSRMPSISVPNGFDRDGLPTGLLISGAKFADGLVLRIAHAYQQATEFHRARPSL
jgi:aspartyl-tRNA(Asn)/glutamyl-tRNA(Gln) amidotransferase subunit A